MLRQCCEEFQINKEREVIERPFSTDEDGYLRFEYAKQARIHCEACGIDTGWVPAGIVDEKWNSLAPGPDVVKQYVTNPRGAGADGGTASAAKARN